MEEGGRHTPGRKTGRTTEDLSSMPVSQKNTSPIKISPHGFLYSSWLWWRGQESSLLLRRAYSKQNGEWPTLKQCQETTKQNKKHITFFGGGQWLQNLGGKTQPSGLFLGKMDCQTKESEREKWSSDLFLSCSPSCWALWKGLRSPRKWRLEILARVHQIQALPSLL